MKKLFCISVLSAFFTIFSFADVIFLGDSCLSPFVRTSEYHSYNIPEWQDISYPTLTLGSSILFSLPHPEHWNFYIGGGSSVNTSNYGFPGVSLSLNSAVSYSFNEDKWPACEIFVFSRLGAGITFIKFINYYMFADLTPYFTLMPAKNKSGFFFGLGPQIEYQQEANWEWYNHLSFGISCMGGFRIRNHN